MQSDNEEHALGVVMSGGDGESRHSQQPRTPPVRDGGANTQPRPAPAPATPPPPQRGS